MPRCGHDEQQSVRNVFIRDATADPPAFPALAGGTDVTGCGGYCPAGDVTRRRVSPPFARRARRTVRRQRAVNILEIAARLLTVRLCLCRQIAASTACHDAWLNIAGVSRGKIVGNVPPDDLAHLVRREGRGLRRFHHRQRRDNQPCPCRSAAGRPFSGLLLARCCPDHLLASDEAA